MLDLVKKVDCAVSEQLLLLLTDSLGVLGSEEVFESGQQQDQQFVLLDCRDKSEELLCEVRALCELCQFLLGGVDGVMVEASLESTDQLLVHPA